MNIVLIAFSQEQQIQAAEIYQFASTYFVTSDIYQQQKELWKYDKAVVILDQFPTNLTKLNKVEHLTNNLDSNYTIFKTLKLLGYQQVLVSLEKIKLQKYKQAITKLEQTIISIFDDQERELEDERNVFSLKNPTLKVVKNCEQNEIKKFFHNEINQTSKLIDDTECIVVRHEEAVHVIKVLKGALYVGQLLKSIKDKAWIQQINISQSGEIFVKFEDNKQLKGILCSYQFCPEEINTLEVEIQLCELPILPPRDVFRKMGQLKMIFYDQEFGIQNSHNNPIQLIGIKQKNNVNINENPKDINFCVCKLALKIIQDDQSKLLNIVSKPIVFFINPYQTVVFYGKITNILEMKNRKIELAQYFPIPKFQITQNMILRDNHDLRQFCRICKTKQVNRVLKECGHLRYCGECVDLCLESKECFYCNRTLTNCYSLSVIYLDQKIFDQLSKRNDQICQINTFKVIEDEKIPKLLKLIYEQQKEGKLDFQTIYCKICDTLMSQRLISCSNGHITLICEECDPVDCKECKADITQKVKILYRFQDDLY
ncbi:unnamed protein product [Paramecium pentaurelia]|uniref:RING-type domain-containing protein n=1 Tax=Paramecium pentaurelia TaxID=43138 RepID=A0A8S1U1Y9_9CILI|nr:unnamed protein product [Paramecium pentaurelia]